MGVLHYVKLKVWKIFSGIENSFKEITVIFVFFFCYCIGNKIKLLSI